MKSSGQHQKFCGQEHIMSYFVFFFLASVSPFIKLQSIRAVIRVAVKPGDTHSNSEISLSHDLGQSVPFS